MRSLYDDDDDDDDDDDMIIIIIITTIIIIMNIFSLICMANAQIFVQISNKEIKKPFMNMGHFKDR